MRAVHRAQVFGVLVVVLIVVGLVFRHDIRARFYNESSVPIALEVEVCINPPLDFDGLTWVTTDVVPPGFEGRTVNGTLRTNGRGGALFRSSDGQIVLSYRAIPDGEMHSEDCKLH